ncbi:MAG: hypothetical protein JNJ55_03770, partial [Betaproteobacteria bacterium]|nr:hypothetical protein [Betaproteobacteria bacterium]
MKKQILRTLYLPLVTAAACLLISMPAAATITTYFSAGAGCGGGTSANFTTSGPAIQVSLCADTTTEGLCGATVYPQVGSSMQNGHFRITARTLSSGITDPSSSITFPVDLTNPPDNGTYVNNFGGSRPGGSPNAPAASAGQVLMTFDIAPQSGAVNSSYTLNLDASEINTTTPATSCFAAFNADPISATFTFNRVIAPAFTSATSTTFTYNSFGTFNVTATGTPAPTFSVTAGTLPSGVTLSSAGVLSGTPTQGGTFPVTITATNGVNPDATQSFTLTVNPISQTITFPVQTVPTRVFAASGMFAIDPVATASSNLAVTHSSLTTSVCTVSGTTVTIVAAGTCTLAANQAGNANYTAAAQQTQGVTITQASQTITFNAQATPSRTFVPGGTFAIAPVATASSNLGVTHSSLTPGVCTVSGTTVTIVAVGTCTLAADQPGNGNFTAATQVTRDVSITQASQTITFGTNPGPVTYA